MAEGSDPFSNTVLELEQEVTCSICHDLYQEPKLLPCCHYYCKQCILSLSNRYPPNQPFPCPNCRELTVLPDNDPDRLTTAFFINRMKELYLKIKGAHGKQETPCEMCTDGKATAFCRKCGQFICDECVKSHRRMKMFADHEVATMEELMEGKTNVLSATNISPSKCAEHDKRKKIFCFDCNNLICKDCIIFDHRNHQSHFVKKIASETRTKLGEHLSPLKNLLPNLCTAISQVRNTKQEIQAKRKTVEEQVNIEFKELYEILEQIKARVLKESFDTAEKKIEKLTAQEKNLGLSMESVQSLIGFVERTLENASDEELIAMQEQVVSKIDAEAMKREKEASSINPVESSDFGVEVFASEELKKLCESNIVAFNGKMAKGDGIQFAEVDQLMRFTLFIPEDKDRKQPPVIEATLISQVDKSILGLNAIPISQRAYSIEYIPTVRGRHQVLISVDRQPITGSPFSVFVSVPPTKLGKPVMPTVNMKSPVHITSNSSDERIVTNYGRDIVILNRQGELVRSIFKSDHNMDTVCGVAIDGDDNIYVSDANWHCLYKFNKAGSLVKSCGKKGEGLEEFHFPRGMVVVGDQVFVCDRKNNRVQVLTTELESIEQFGTGGQLKEPESIAVDNEQLLYVADSNHHIQVFTIDGKFIHSIPKNGITGGHPQGVCISASYVYIADHAKNCISVFTKEGQFITSFGQDHIERCYGIYMDRDGFLHVCSNSNGQVIVF